ncbi:hypothetical protein HMPREF9336_02108 [Segniliparus rugosus ATCC BAA-974]|uniref:CMP/dCMP-type deaminase domain-containing protein n=2 Tax=Segniliparus rugosus TaxID=286804 RepID=E5XRI5_SEGRC|nr:hypothetical protein HMPREF9336_02108 [Segniliparus rugosus ATCC BAA-974]
MRKAMHAAAGNPRLPFGSVIVRTSDNAMLAKGVNHNTENPMWHGEVVALNDYTARHGNADWRDVTLYTTGEPCAMCAGAIIWAGIPRVVWASSIATIRASGEGQIDIPATEVAARAEEFYRPEYFLGGVLSDQTDPVFLSRPR